ncbi:MAG: lipopolysaccharide assembly protein LapA domain-containing protein [Rickettsiales bacterium]
MLKLLALLVYGVLGFVSVLFILSNREPVILGMFPFAGSLEVPAYAALAAMFATGLLIGIVYAFKINFLRRQEIRRLKKQLTAYQKAHDPR